MAVAIKVGSDQSLPTVRRHELTSASIVEECYRSARGAVVRFRNPARRGIRQFAQGGVDAQHWIPVNASGVEAKRFDEARESCKTGWSGTFDNLDAHLAK
jgi:hypothetical protein